MITDKVRPHHLERKALLYVRQPHLPDGAAVRSRGTNGVRRVKPVKSLKQRVCG